MKFNYIYCIKDGFYKDDDFSDKKCYPPFVKKGKCYCINYNNDIISSFINEQKGTHFFGALIDSDESIVFFNKHFKKPNCIHLIIEKKIKTKK